MRPGTAARLILGTPTPKLLRIDGTPIPNTTEPGDTTDLVSQRQGLAQLDATLKAQAQGLSRDMLHVPGEP